MGDLRSGGPEPMSRPLHPSPSELQRVIAYALIIFDHSGSLKVIDFAKIESPFLMLINCDLNFISYRFNSAAALHAMQSVVIPTAIPSVCPSVRHTLVPNQDE